MLANKQYTDKWRRYATLFDPPLKVGGKDENSYRAGFVAGLAVFEAALRELLRGEKQ